MKNLKLIISLLAAVFGNPFYQFFSYILCSIFKFGKEVDFNTYQANSIAFIVVMIAIFLVRYFIYKWMYVDRNKDILEKENVPFLQLFSERHIFQVLGAITFYFWVQPLEGNIIGFIVMPLTIILGLILSIITIMRIRKLKSIISSSIENSF